MLDPFDSFHSISDDLERVNRRAAANEQSRQSKANIMEVEEKIDKLTLVCMAMWSLMQDKMGVTEEQLLERVKMLDMMDGVADGKATRGVAQCPKCDRTMSPRHKKCLYCGHQQLVQSAFDAI